MNNYYSINTIQIFSSGEEDFDQLMESLGRRQTWLSWEWCMMQVKVINARRDDVASRAVAAGWPMQADLPGVRSKETRPGDGHGMARPRRDWSGYQALCRA